MLLRKNSSFARTIAGVARIDIAGPGFINFTLAPEVFAKSIDEARSADTWGAGLENRGKKIMVEYNRSKSVQGISHWTLST